MAGQHTIKVTKYSDVIEEKVAAAAIIPGMLLELTNVGQVQAHSVAGGNALIRFALEDEMQGKGINDAYAAPDQVQVWIPYRGDIVQAILADTNDVDIGDYLESDGNGYLQLHTADADSWEMPSPGGSISINPNQIIAQAIEALDTSHDSSTESSVEPLILGERILVRII